MPARVAENVFLIQVPSLFPVGATNCYLFNSGEPSLIDVGLKTNKSYETLIRELSSINLAPKNIGKVVVTHAHVDHFGLIRKLQESSSCDVFVHAEDFQYVSNYEGAYLRRMDFFGDLLRNSGTPPKILDDLQSAYLFLRDVGGTPDNCKKINDGDTIRMGDVNLDVVHTPGHTIGEITLIWKERGILFCGDHLLKDITPNVGVTLREGPHLSLLPDYMRSLEKTTRMLGDAAFPGHRALIHDFRSRASEIMRHHQERKNIMLSSIMSGEKNASEISKIVFGRIPLSEIPLAIAETMSHMTVLVDEGKVSSNKRGEVVYYSVKK
jgi:glyoxylase-like metal-dependent hydrolase (beta-lactamase superfamily II)